MVGATYPEELAEVRAIADDLPILVAGIGAQDGHLAKTVRGDWTPEGAGLYRERITLHNLCLTR